MKDGSRGMLGLIDFASRSDMETALRKLDDSEFRNPYDT
jgi:arginine/serine-rich splicing factor 1/9